MSHLHSDSVHEVLGELPELSAWFASHGRVPSIETLPEFHLWHLVRAMRSQGLNRSRIWIDSARLILDTTPSMLDHALETDSLAVSLGRPLTELYSLLAESAIRSGDGEKAFHTLKALADSTGLAAFRFLSAWTAFNNEDLQACISECEQVTEPFAPLHTLLGQALLEAGQPLEAIDSLKVAIKLNPADPLPRVQLVKAYLVTNLQVEAMRVIDECRQLVGDHIEVECLAAMSILAGPNRRQDFCERTLKQFAKHMESLPSDIEAFSIAMELSTELNRKDWATKFASTFELQPSEKLPMLGGKISFILKKIGERQWYDVARQVIDKTLSATQSSLSDLNGSMFRQ